MSIDSGENGCAGTRASKMCRKARRLYQNRPVTGISIGERVFEMLLCSLSQLHESTEVRTSVSSCARFGDAPSMGLWLVEGCRSRRVQCERDRNLPHVRSQPPTVKSVV